MEFLIQNILVVLQDILAAICFICVMYNIWQYRERNRICTIITAVTATGASIANVIVYSKSAVPEDAFIILGFFSTIIPLIAPQIILRSKKHIKTTAILFTIQITAESLYGIVSNVIDTDPDAPVSRIIELSLTIIGYIFIIVLLTYFSRNRELSTVKNALDTVPRWLYIVWFILSYTMFFRGSENDFDFPGTKIVFNILFVLSAIGVLICIVYFVYKIFSMSYQQTQILKQLSEQHNNYENMLSSDQQLRQFRHDYKNHMMVVTALLNAGKTETAAEYLEEIKIQSGIAARQISTGNFVADAILNNKNSLAHELDIEMTFTGAVPERGIDNSDLCTVLGNLVDNAIEGTNKYNGDKYIKLESVFRNNILVLTVTNPVNQKVEIKNNHIRTTKSDTRNHGIGLKNVEKIAEKYNGKFILSCDDKEFTADISMKLCDES